MSQSRYAEESRQRNCSGFCTVYLNTRGGGSGGGALPLEDLRLTGFGLISSERKKKLTVRKVKKLLPIFKCMNLDGPQINAFEMLNFFSFNQHILVPVIFAMFRAMLWIRIH